MLRTKPEIVHFGNGIQAISYHREMNSLFCSICEWYRIFAKCTALLHKVESMNNIVQLGLHQV